MRAAFTRFGQTRSSHFLAPLSASFRAWQNHSYSRGLATIPIQYQHGDWRKWAAGLVGASLAAYLYTEKPHACGIMAFLGDEPAIEYLLEGLSILQNRGYDSAGVATITENKELVTTKYASKGSTSDSLTLLKDEAPSRHKAHNIGIAHTRWATHGSRIDSNAHPHSDYKDRISLVHNGTIENSGELKQELMAKKITFRSETDTEVIANLIGAYLDEGAEFSEAVKKALDRLEGTWGLAIIKKDQPDQLIAARNGSPLVVGIGKGRMFLASEVTAFSRYTKEFIALRDGEMAVIKKDGVSLDLSRKEKAPHEEVELSPAPYPHWTIKEIMEQPAAISRTLNYGGRFDVKGDQVKLGGLDLNAPVLKSIRNLVLTGCGTSLFACQYAALIMRALGIFDTVQSLDAAEITAENFPPQGGLLAVSQSGETRDTLQAVKLAETCGIPRLSVVNQVGSLMARTTGCGVYLNAGREQAVASTKAFTTQVTALALIAAWFSQNKDGAKAQPRIELIKAIHQLPIYSGMVLQTRQQCADIAQKILASGSNSLFVLGKGYSEPIAREGALKIKEITYIHAEGYNGGALKHGPFALLTEGTPVVLLILEDQHAELMKIACHEVKTRGAYTIVITDKPKMVEGIANEIIPLPHNGPLTALLGVIPLQMIAYELSVAKGNNPDRPRNLAKAVTVS